MFPGYVSKITIPSKWAFSLLMVSILDEVFGMRLTLFISILSCLILLPCWLVMNHLKPPLNFISPGTTQRAAVGFVISIIIKFIANDKLTDDGHVAAIITGTLLTAASPVFIIGIGFNHSLFTQIWSRTSSQNVYRGVTH